MMLHVYTCDDHHLAFARTADRLTLCPLCTQRTVRVSLRLIGTIDDARLAGTVIDVLRSEIRQPSTVYGSDTAYGVLVAAANVRVSEPE